MSDLPFETLIESNECKIRWYPQSVETYKSAFKIDKTIENASALLSNLAYNMQYLEYLEKELFELKLSDVIVTMLYKTYIITGMSILEGLFSNIIKSNGYWKTSTLESQGTTQSSKTNFSGVSYTVKTELFKTVDKYQLQMDLNSLIDILNKHHSVLEIDHLIYPALKRLKDLRNRVHLQKSNGNYDHDYNAFNFSDKNEMGKILFEILTSENITNNPKVFDFLKVNI